MSKIVKLILVGLTVFTIFEHTQNSKSAKAPLKTAAREISQTLAVEGQGAPRGELGQCEHDLPQLTKSLKALGLKVLEAPSCMPTRQSGDAYAPTFKVISKIPLLIEIVEGGKFNSLSFCEIQAQRMAVEIAKPKTVLETTCRKLNENLFQPSIAVISKVAAE